MSDRITRAELTLLAEERFGDMVKAAVDIERRVMGVGGERHSDQEAALLHACDARTSLLVATPWEAPVIAA